MKKGKALVVHSGGQDSTTCLLLAMRDYEEVEAVAFDYGQRHKKELECAKAICEKLGVRQTVLSLEELNQLAPNSLTRTDIPVDESAPEEGTPNTFVEGRNLLFLTYAAIYAKTHGIRDIFTGVSQSDFSGYPDCRDIFIKSLNVTLNLAMDYDFNLITPLMWIDKEETWALADELGGFELVRDMTLTCYNGIVGEGCGNCPACKLRKRGYDRYVTKKHDLHRES
ncbi:MAG: 7-cyano-7-deazaguanine synthase QueC [Eubacterium sp.]|nr:7-cyano-7-deazaguanine synthase QueC [Eubacterium sp.]MBR6172331.1 7-cyano-7-deazaguanine synthase QueC [Eubacterium sp.]